MCPRRRRLLLRNRRFWPRAPAGRRPIFSTSPRTTQAPPRWICTRGFSSSLCLMAARRCSQSRLRSLRASSRRPLQWARKRSRTPTEPLSPQRSRRGVSTRALPCTRIGLWGSSPRRLCSATRRLKRLSATRSAASSSGFLAPVCSMARRRCLSSRLRWRLRPGRARAPRQRGSHRRRAWTRRSRRRA
eukprot:Amastigsp_a518420_42.p3 type:complete len:188 gc:universal Amastigsp_a518420_42:731-168(-)